MSTERVDKAWQRKGLKEYSTEAILGTMGHYGVQVAEADFRQLAEKEWPRGIAQQWATQWKGTGQFTAFPWVAAQELWRRWLPERAAPVDLTQALAELMDALVALLEGNQQAPVGPAFQRMDTVRQQVPRDEKGLPLASYLQEALEPFDEKAAETFNGLAEALTAEGHVEDAEAFADVEEFLMPERRGVSRAIVRAKKGEKDGATEDLRKVVADATRSHGSRLLAVDGMIHISDYEAAAASARTLMEEGEREKDWHLALDACARVKHAFESSGNRGALIQIERDQARLEAAHDEAHPTHRRHAHSH